MKTEDEVIEVVDRALLSVRAPIDELLRAVLDDVPRRRRRRKLFTALGATVAVAAVTAAVIVGGVLTSGRDGSLGPTGDGDASTDSSARPPSDVLNEAEMLAVLGELAPGHEFSNFSTYNAEAQFIGSPADGGREMMQLYGTVDGAFFTFFVIRDPAGGLDQPSEIRQFVNCDNFPHGDGSFCEGGFESYPDGSSRLLTSETLVPWDGENQRIMTSALVFFPNGVETGATVTNMTREGFSTIVSPQPVFSVHELERIAADQRWLDALED
jgi:hypothetical protein